MNNTIDFNGTPLRLVPHEPDNGFLFYVANNGRIDGDMHGLRIDPFGKQDLVNARPSTTENCSIASDAKRIQRYWKYNNAWGHNESNYVAHAVFLAWSDQTIPPGHQIHHLNGITTDNHIDNLMCLSFHDHRYIADERQKLLRTVVPDGDLSMFPYARLRELQDPHNLTDAEFQTELENTGNRIEKIRTLVPNDGSLSLFPIDLLCELLDPHITSDEAFERALLSVIPAPPGIVLPDCTPEPLRDV